MAIGIGSSLVDIAFEVGTALERANIQAVLRGGSAAVFYSDGIYSSNDLDFVLRYGESGERVVGVLGQLGFTQDTSRQFTHPLTIYSLEFPRGPVLIGDKLIGSHDIVRNSKGQTVRVLTPSDATCDRLLKFAAWNDYEGLGAALAVCSKQPGRIDISAIRDFMQTEGKGVYASAFSEKWAIFERRLRELPNFSEIVVRKKMSRIVGAEVHYGA